jgi:hypothetical protein
MLRSLEPLKIGLKVLTPPLKDLLGSDGRPIFLLSIILGPLGSLIPSIFEFAQQSLPGQYLLHFYCFERIFKYRLTST